jgi:hypothetical protein
LGPVHDAYGHGISEQISHDAALALPTRRALAFAGVFAAAALILV